MEERTIRKKETVEIRGFLTLFYSILYFVNSGNPTTTTLHPSPNQIPNNRDSEIKDEKYQVKSVQVFEKRISIFSSCSNCVINKLRRRQRKGHYVKEIMILWKDAEKETRRNVSFPFNKVRMVGMRILNQNFQEVPNTKSE